MSTDRARPSRRWSAAFAAGALAAAVTAGCTQFGASSDDDGAAPADRPVATVTVPPVRLTPFCQAMIDLADRLERDPPADIEAAIVAAYESIADEVPDAIRDDFDVVLADLRGQPLPDPIDTDTTDTDTIDTDTIDTDTSVPSPTFDPGPPVTDETGATLPPGDPFFDEGYDAEDSPALRLNAYVDFECRDVGNNPGPPATQPSSDNVVTDEE